MKKSLLAAAMAFAISGSAFAQQGQMAAGVSLGVAPSLESNLKATNFQIGAKFQYGITDDIRAEADVEYGFKSKDISVFDITVNAHYLIDIAPKLKLYPLVGIGYASLSQSWGVKTSFSDFLSDIGVSESYFNQLPAYMQDQFKAQFDKVEESTSGSESVSRFVFNIGIGGEYEITDNIMMNLEFKYQYLKDFNRMPIVLGVAYKF